MTVVTAAMTPKIFEIKDQTDPGVPEFSCSNGIQDGPEPDVDCGLPCGKSCGFRMKCFNDDDCEIGRCTAEKDHMKVCSDVGLYVSFPGPNDGAMTAGQTFPITWSVSNDTIVQDLNGDDWKVDLSLVNEDGIKVIDIAEDLSWSSSNKIDLETYSWTSNGYIPTGLYRIMAKWSGPNSDTNQDDKDNGFVTGILFQIYGTSIDVLKPLRNTRMMVGTRVTSEFIVSGSVTYVDVILTMPNATKAFSERNLGTFPVTVGGVSTVSVKIPNSANTGVYALRVESTDFPVMVNSLSPSFFAKDRPGVVITSPTYEQPFTEGEKMTITWETEGLTIGQGMYAGEWPKRATSRENDNENTP